MPDATPLPESLRAPLGRLKLRRLLLAALRGVGIGLSVLLLGALIAGWADLIVALPVGVRVALFGALVVAALALLAWAIVSAGRRSTPIHLASALDTAGGTNGQIRAGVELAEHPAAESSPLTADLARRAVELSSRLAAQQDVSRAQPAAPALRPFAIAAAAALFIAGAWMIWPNLVAAQASRFLDLQGTQARHSPYVFEITPSAERIRFGEPLEVVVRITNAQPDERFDWIVEQPGRKPWRSALIVRPDGTLFGGLSAVVSDLRFHVVGPRGESARQSISVINTPQILETGVRLVYPAYTALPPFEGALPEGGPSGVRGTQVTLVIASNRPLKGGRIELRAAKSTTAQSVLMSPRADAKSVSGTFELLEDLAFEASVEDVDGNAAKDPLRGRCLLAPDHGPRAILAEPRLRSFATPEVPLPASIEIEDDFGIGEVILYRSLNGSRDAPFKVELPAKSPRVGKLSVPLPLPDWQLDAGDTLELRVLVRDNDPQGAKSAETPVHRVSIITRDQYLEMLRQQETIDDLEERYKPWLERLVELRRGWQQARKDGDPAKIAETKKALREMVEQLEEHLKEPPVFSADLQFAKELKELQETLRQLQENMDAGEYDMVDTRLSDAEADLKKDLELPLEMLVKLYRLIEDESIYTMLAQVQTDLARRVKRFEKLETLVQPQDTRDMKALMEEEQEVLSALRKLLQDIRDHAGQLPKDNEKLKKVIDSAEAFATKIHDSQIEELLDQSLIAMAANRGTESFLKTNEAAELMMSFVQKSGGGFGGGAADALREFGPHLPSTANQMLNGKGLPGMGQGGGRGGYSVGGKNQSVGLYGQRQLKRGAPGQGGGKKKSGNVSSGETMGAVKGFGVQNQFDDGASSAVPLSALPGRYRSAVRDFNRRVSDDWTKRP